MGSIPSSTVSPGWFRAIRPPRLDGQNGGNVYQGQHQVLRRPAVELRRAGHRVSHEYRERRHGLLGRAWVLRDGARQQGWSHTAGYRRSHRSCGAASRAISDRDTFFLAKTCYGVISTRARHFRHAKSHSRRISCGPSPTFTATSHASSCPGASVTSTNRVN